MKDIDLNELSHEDLKNRAREVAGRSFEERLSTIEEEYRNPVLQRILLAVIDERWKEHLYDIDHLKSGISFRAYAQKDPLIEYKQEAYRMFIDLLEEIKKQVATLFFRARVVPQESMARREAPTAGIQVNHASPVSAFAGAAEAQEKVGARRAVPGQSPAASGGAGKKQPVIREGDKVGRNDPCPCGSGRKYKKRCGK